MYPAVTSLLNVEPFFRIQQYFADNTPASAAARGLVPSRNMPLSIYGNYLSLFGHICWLIIPAACILLVMFVVTYI